MLADAYEAVVWVYDAIDESHEDYMNLVDKATIKVEGDHLHEPFKLYSLFHLW